MRTANPKLEQDIRKKTLELLLKKEPYEIGMRDIANACNVSAAALYHYYKDKKSLFEAIKIDCLNDLNAYLSEQVLSAKSLFLKTQAALGAFRDWCFDNPQIALLVMGKLQANDTATPEELEPYYRNNEFGNQLLEESVAAGIAESDDTHLDTAVAISALWGTIEAILLKRADARYWNSGKAYTDRFIHRYLSILFPKEKQHAGTEE